MRLGSLSLELAQELKFERSKKFKQDLHLVLKVQTFYSACSAKCLQILYEQHIYNIYI